MLVEEVSERHYDNLKRAIRSVPVHNVLIIPGDFNAQVGKEDIQYSYHEKTNRNGKILLDLAMEKHLEITNTRFRKRSGKQWTFLRPGNAKSQIDFILVSKKWRNNVKNVETYNSFSNIGSDHRIVTAEIRLSLRKNLEKLKSKKYDWEIFKNNPTLQQAYSVEVINEFDLL